MKKRFLLPVLSLLLVLLAVLSGCKAPALSAEFTESEVYDRAVSVVELLNAADYEGVNALMRADVQPQLPASTLKDVCDTYLVPKGAFEKVSASSVYGAASGDKSESYAVAALACKYANGKITYTLSFDKDLALVGLYLK